MSYHDKNGTIPPTGATLFSGFEGVGLGMKAAGIQHAWGIEYDPAIAAVAQLNGFNTIVADILDCDPADFPDVSYLHASTLCKSGSQANASSEGETENDLRLAERVCLFILKKRPSFFTLENVWLYRTFESFQKIISALANAGYFYHFEHVDMSDFGIPQSRKRLILRASRIGLLRPFVGNANDRVGWDSVMPQSPGRKAVLTKHQQAAVEGLPQPLLIDTQNKHPNGKPFTIRLAGEPSMTIVASGRRRIKLVNGSVSSLGIEQVATLQTFPKWYRYPDDSILAQTGLGNAVPPLFAQRLFESLIP